MIGVGRSVTRKATSPADVCIEPRTMSEEKYSVQEAQPPSGWQQVVKVAYSRPHTRRQTEAEAEGDVEDPPCSLIDACVDGNETLIASLISKNAAVDSEEVSSPYHLRI